MDIPGKLIEQLVQKNCVAFVGAGPSMSVGLPNWPQLLQRMIEWCESHGVTLSNRADIEGIIRKNDLPSAADVLRDRMGEDKYRAFMEEVFLRSDLKPTEVHRLLAELPFAGLATSNYDPLVESGYREVHSGKPLEVFTQVDYEQLAKALREKKPFVLKAHGTIERFETIVLGKSDYSRLIHESPGYRTFLRALFTSMTVLFIGFSMTDPELLLLLDELKTIFKGHAVPHYALMDVTNVTATEQELFVKNYGVQIIPYQATAGYPEVKSFLTELLRKVTKNAVWYQAEEAEKSIKDDDPNYRVFVTSKNELHVEQKYPGAAEKFPLKTSVKLKFDKTTPEGREGHEAMKRQQATGEPVTIKGAHIVDVEMPELIRRYMPDVVAHVEISMGVTRGTGKPLPVKVTIECEDGETATLDNILLENVQSGSEQMILSNEHQDVPWKFKQVIREKEDEASFTFTFNDIGLPVKRALDGLSFSRALARGGVLRIESLNTGSQLAHAQIVPGTFESPDPHLTEVLEALLLIQKKTRATFTSPENVSIEEANAIFSAVQVLKTGTIEFKPEPYINSTNVEQARDALNRFAGEETISISQYLEEWVSPILNQEVELGPVLITCERFYITPEDLDTLREAVNVASPGEMIKLRFTPVPGVKLEAKFLNWLPADEVERVRKMPFVRITSLKNLVGMLFETAYQEPVPFDVDLFMDLLAEAREQKSAEGKPLNFLSSATPEELYVTFEPFLARIATNDKFRLAAKLSEQKWLSTNEVARLIGMDETAFVQELKRAGMVASDNGGQTGDNNARSVGSKT